MVRGAIGVLMLCTFAALSVASGRQLSSETWATPTPLLPTYPCSYKSNVTTITSWNLVYVNPATGVDASGRGSATAPLKTFGYAFYRIPAYRRLTRGYKILIAQGNAQPTSLWMEGRWGTATAPILVQPLVTGQLVTFANIDVYNCTYLYFQGMSFAQNGGDVVHFAYSDYIWLSKVSATGSRTGVQETIKVNQVKGMYIEDSNVTGASDNAIDFVAVQYGHICKNRIWNADWCIYAKGGSAYILIDSNNVSTCDSTGIAVGQGTGFEYMIPNWLHYEGYGIRVTNNILKSVHGAALGVWGGYNVLVAHNTAYSVGRRSHLIEFLFGSRSCDGEVDKCTKHRDMGGWGPYGAEDGGGAVPIPNKNVLFLNNLIVNPSGVKSQWQHLTVQGFPSDEQNVFPPTLPTPPAADDGLVIAGNVIVNGGATMELGLGEDQGCLDTNPTCNRAQILSSNSINKMIIGFASTSTLKTSSASTTALKALPTTIKPLPPFTSWATLLPTPTGTLSNTVPVDKAGVARTATNTIPGAYVG